MLVKLKTQSSMKSMSIPNEAWEVFNPDQTTHHLLKQHPPLAGVHWSGKRWRIVLNRAKHFYQLFSLCDQVLFQVTRRQILVTPGGSGALHVPFVPLERWMVEANKPEVIESSRRVYCGHTPADQMIPLGDNYRLVLCKACYERLLGSIVDSLLERGARWYIQLQQGR